jgi:putative transposase
MKYNPNIHHRRSIRLKGYDYSQEGLYYITICCQNWACLFGKIIVGASLVDAQDTDSQNIEDQHQIIEKTLILNNAGKMIEKEWLALLNRFNNIQLHEYIVMPNHFHGILQIVSKPEDVLRATRVVAQNDNIAQNDNELDNDKGRPQGHAPATNKTIGDMMDAFKSITTVEYIRGVKNMGWKPFNGKLWQRNYYEHIIRNEKSYQNISRYIITNPSHWKNDKFF